MLNITRFSLSLRLISSLRGRKLTDQKWRSIGKLNTMVHSQFHGAGVYTAILITVWATKLRFPLAGESSSRVSSRNCGQMEAAVPGLQPRGKEMRLSSSSEAFRRYGTIEWRNRRWEREGFERRNYTGCVVGFAAHTLKKNRACICLVIHVETRGKQLIAYANGFLIWNSIPGSRSWWSIHVSEWNVSEGRKKKKTLDHM